MNKADHKKSLKKNPKRGGSRGNGLEGSRRARLGTIRNGGALEWPPGHVKSKPQAIRGHKRAGRAESLNGGPSTRRLVGPHSKRGQQGPAQTGVSRATTDRERAGPQRGPQAPIRTESSASRSRNGERTTGTQNKEQGDCKHDEECGAASGQGAAGPRPYGSQRDHNRAGAHGAQTGPLDPQQKRLRGKLASRQEADEARRRGSLGRGPHGRRPQTRGCRAPQNRGQQGHNQEGARGALAGPVGPARTGSEAC